MENMQNSTQKGSEPCRELSFYSTLHHCAKTYLTIIKQQWYWNQNVTKKNYIRRWKQETGNPMLPATDERNRKPFLSEWRRTEILMWKFRVWDDAHTATLQNHRIKAPGMTICLKQQKQNRRDLERKCVCTYCTCWCVLQNLFTDRGVCGQLGERLPSELNVASQNSTVCTAHM